MEHLNEYSIPHKGLDLGLHEYKFQLNHVFFSHYEESLIKKGNVGVKMILDKRSSMMVLKFIIEGSFVGNCDRCLNSIDIGLDDQNELMIKYSEDPHETDEVVYINPNEPDFNVANYIYEFVILAMPLSKTRDCENEDYKFCNHKVLERLESIEDEMEVEEDEEKNTGLWDALKDLDID